MATKYQGFDSTVLEVDIAQIIDGVAGEGTVDTPASWQVTAVAGNRKVSIAPGTGTDAFVRVTTDTAVVLDIPTPTTAGRWYLIFARRNWSNNTLAFGVGNGATTTTTTPAALTANTSSPRRAFALSPYQYPTLNRAAGVVKDQPIAWVFANNANNTLVIRDIRRDKKYGRRMGLNESYIEERSFDGPFNSTKTGAFTDIVTATVTLTDDRFTEVRFAGSWRGLASAAGLQVLTINDTEVTPRQKQHNHGITGTIPFELYWKGYLPSGGNDFAFKATADSAGAIRTFEYLSLSLIEA